ncbi:hypothetical protein J3R82DRAFT_2972 [Butyriboletus roseoflavus]|nr:hypothetical protein J3R82DRAFT_2972 [Butyriboletus roseoflavus]
MLLSLLHVPPTTSEEQVGSPEFWGKIAISAVLVLAGGVFAGLTLGLMGLDELHLRVLATSSEDVVERKNAQKGALAPISRPPLFSSSQSCGSCTKAAIGSSSSAHPSLSLNRLCSHTPPGPSPSQRHRQREFTHLFGRCHWRWYCSRRHLHDRDCHLWRVRLFLLATPSTHSRPLSRIIPQAVSVRYGLAVGARCAPFVLSLMYVFAPIAWPIAKLLDHVLGVNEAHTYKKAELKSFLQFHRTGEEPLRDDEISILNGVLELNTKNVETIMTPIKDVVTLCVDTVMDHATVDAILNSGYSRIPIHEPGEPLAFRGLLLVKKLLAYDPAKALPVSHFKLSILPEAHPSINCFHALDYFQTGRAHLLLVSRTPGLAGGGIGVITLEDIIEEIISEEIVDETDQFEDNQSKRHAKRLTNAALMRGIVERERTFTRIVSAECTPLLASPPLPSEHASFSPLAPHTPQQIQQQIQQHQLQYHSVGHAHARDTGALLRHQTPLQYGAVNDSPKS